MRSDLIPAIVLASMTCSACAQVPTPDVALMQRLRQNSSLYADWDKGESLRAKANQTSGDIRKKLEQSDNYFVDTDHPVIDPADDPVIKISTLHSDLVAVGKVTRTMSGLTAHEAFIYSDAQFAVSSVWYRSTENLVALGDPTGNEVTVTFPGGYVETDGHKLDIQLSSEPPLQIGHTYLLFLQYLPASNTYKMIDFKGFDLTNHNVRTMYRNPERDARPIMADKEAFLHATQESVTRANSEGRK
jgi:hypothetical protein